MLAYAMAGAGYIRSDIVGAASVGVNLADAAPTRFSCLWRQSGSYRYVSLAVHIVAALFKIAASAEGGRAAPIEGCFIAE